MHTVHPKPQSSAGDERLQQEGEVGRAVLYEREEGTNALKIKAN